MIDLFDQTFHFANFLKIIHPFYKYLKKNIYLRKKGWDYVFKKYCIS